MDAVDWTGLGVLAALMVGCVGYLARQIDRLRSDMTDGNRELGTRIERLSDAYVRHLEHHASGGA